MVSELVRRARRRLFWNEFLAEGTLAVTAALGILVLLLLLGTQVLDWRLLVIVPTITLLVGIYRALRRVPGAYVTAQIIDRRSGLDDTLSTAVHFAISRKGFSESVREAQQRTAESVLPRVVLAQSIPLVFPRATYAAAVLALVASSLFALRYGLERHLDLKPPLARILQRALGLDETVQKAALDRKASQKRPDLQNVLGVPLGDADPGNPSEVDGAPDSALDTVGVPEVDNAEAQSVAKGARGEQGSPNGENQAASEQEGLDTGSEDSADGQQGTGQKGQSPRGDGNQGPGNSNNSSNLLSKFRDAMSDLLSRMKQPGTQGGQQQSATAQNGGQKSGQPVPGQRGQQGQQQGQGQPSDSQDGQSGENAENAMNAMGRGSGQSSDQQASKQPGSGMGQQDGNKDVKLAEQMAAMGKISEIIGKRSANVSGEVTMEVQSTQQQLQTPYSRRNATHAEAGGEISRDEVPVSLQPYVQQYFEQVRRPIPAK